MCLSIDVWVSDLRRFGQSQLECIKKELNDIDEIAKTEECMKRTGYKGTYVPLYSVLKGMNRFDHLTRPF